MFIFLVIERGLVATVAFFKTVLGDASLHSSSKESRDVSSVANTLYRTSAWEGTPSFITAFASWLCGLLLTQSFVVLSGDQSIDL